MQLTAMTISECKAAFDYQLSKFKTTMNRDNNDIYN